MKKKLLILPSWYIHPNDEINGSFFQEQAELISDIYDVRVLNIRLNSRPSIRKIYDKPYEAIKEWFKYLFYTRQKTNLPNLRIYNKPYLLDYTVTIFKITNKYYYKKIYKNYTDIYKELDKEGWRPDLIHAHSAFLGGLIALKLNNEYKIPYIITEHVPFNISDYDIDIRKKIKEVFTKAEIVLSLGYDKVRQLGMSDIDVETNLIYNYVNETKFNELCKKYKPGNKLKLVTIGAASHYKDHKTLIKALSLLKIANIPFELTIIGLKAGGVLYNETVDFIKENHLETNIKIIEKAERNSINKLLVVNEIFIITSIAEGLPVSVLEGMATGLFVVSTRHGGTEDILTEKTGAITEIKNYKKIFQILEEIYNGKITLNPLKIREHIISICGNESFKNRLSGYYNKILES